MIIKLLYLSLEIKFRKSLFFKLILEVIFSQKTKQNKKRSDFLKPNFLPLPIFLTFFPYQLFKEHTITKFTSLKRTIAALLCTQIINI